jgi:glycosyltransferase involved in cell wall biosynthesis
MRRHRLVEERHPRSCACAHQNIVCVSTIDWDFLWQEHQGVMSVLARAGNRVLFVENTGVRSPGWKDRGRVISRLRKWMSGEGRFRTVADNVALYSPLALPFPYTPLAQRINRVAICGSIRRWLEHNRFAEPILFTFLPTQFTLDLMDTIAPTLSIFYCTDKLSETSPAARRILPYERRVVERADLVFASSDRLVDYCRAHNPETHLFPIGVSLEKFEHAWRDESIAPPDVTRLPRPVIGLVGGLRSCVDQALVRELSLCLPHVSIALVGPEQTPMTGLHGLANVHLLGPKPHELVPNYVAAFDACLIPYVVDDFTNNISPAKLNEYMALGKPVVSTDLAEVRRFNETHGAVVRIGATHEEFIDQVQAALENDTRAQREERRSAAERNSWERRVEAMSRLIEAGLCRTPQSTAR